MTRHKRLWPLVLCWGSLLSPLPAHAQSGTTQALHALRVSAPPILDGILNEDVWSGDPMVEGTWVSYNPLRGEPAQQPTQVWIAYDERAIYVAFRCYDDSPDQIRTTISRRDTAWNDDWVALSLDSNRAGQVAYHMFMNPSGVQMDALQTTTEDAAADWVWQSIGRIDDTGYVVEMRLPLESIRFNGGSDVTMGIMFFRRMSRLGVSWSWPEMPPGTWVFEAHVPVVFEQLRQPRLLEVIPSTTFSRTQTRDAGAWRDPDSGGDLGVSVKYGLTSAITFDGTVNPDFSQVESDAFQVEVNQRFPTFFSEKRPFFMEGLGLFNLAGAGGDSTMRTAVHTRRIIEPGAGVKLTGSSGRQTFALLSSNDQSVTDDAQRIFTIGRGMRNFGDGQYAGVLVTDVEHGTAYNRVLGADIALKHGESFRWNGSVLSTHSRSSLDDATQGVGAQVSYGYNTYRVTLAGQIEHYDRGFQMDTAFLNRVGVTRAWQYQEMQFYPDATGNGWLKRIAPYLWVMKAEDRIQGGDEALAVPGLRFNFTRQGQFQINLSRGHETFAGQRFDTSRLNINGGAQWRDWLNLSARLNRGQGVFYDPADPFAGTSTSAGVSLGLQPNANLSHQISYSFATFTSERTGEQVFEAHVVNVRNIYQFNRQFFVRLITQLDTSRRRVLGDFLASYELVPGTVVHLGYGSLLEGPGGRAYSPTGRAFFFKASYLARL